jgi:hypothetical protein
MLNTPGELGRRVRLALQSAKTFYLDPIPKSEQEFQEAAKCYPYEDFSRGIGQQLASLPELERRYRDGPDVNPDGRALIDAVIDWRRTGANRPVSEPELRKLYPAYVRRIHSVDDVDDERFQRALSWALEPIAAHHSLLDVEGQGPIRSYRPHPHLLVLVSEGTADDHAE